MTRHSLVNPDGMPPARGFSYGVVAGGGRTLHLAGITGHAEDMTISDDYVEQFGAACDGVARVVVEAGGQPDDVVSMVIYTTDVDQYRSRTKEIGDVYRRVFGKHFPAMALIGVDELVDPKAKVELVCVAVV